MPVAFVGSAFCWSVCLDLTFLMSGKVEGVMSFVFSSGPRN